MPLLNQNKFEMSLNATLKSLITGLVFAGMLFTVSCNHKDNEINATCFDEIQNQDEERVDCGGPNCPPCPPTCDDGILNQEEQFIDCGGPNCPPCGTCTDGIQNEVWSPELNAFVMEQGVDCGFPCSDPCPPSCTNGIQDGDEEGIDCGGSCPNPCPPPTCNDGVWNGLETGVDCGGPQCPPCPIPSCNDGIQNQNETGIDCGGVCPNDCPPPTCFDGVQNQGEAGIDCGFPCVTACPEESCNDGVWNNGEDWIDCGGPCPNVCPNCSDGVQNGPEVGVDCVIGDVQYFEEDGVTICPQCPTCEDGIQNQSETYIDCGGPNCPPCEMILNAEMLGIGLESAPFVGENITVTQQGFNITASATQTIGGQTRTLVIRVPLAMEEGTPEQLTPWLGGAGPSVQYTNFAGIVFNAEMASGNMLLTLKTQGFAPNHVMGGIDTATMVTPPPATGTATVTGITFFLNY